MSKFIWDDEDVDYIDITDSVEKFRADQRRNAMGQFAPEGVGGGDGVREVTEFDFGDGETKSPNNPGMLDERGPKFWVEGQFKNSSYQQVGNDILRHTMEGQLGLPLSPYARRYKNDVRGIEPYDEYKVNQLSENMIESLDAAKPAQPTLWRGIQEPTTDTSAGDEEMFDAVMELRVGDEMASPMFSTTRNPEIAQMYASMNVWGGEGNTNYDNPVIFKIQAGAKGLKTNLIAGDAEVLSGGKFKVVDVVNYKFSVMGGVKDPDRPNRYKVDNDGNVIEEQKTMRTARIITLEQVATFSPDDIIDQTYLPNDDYSVDRYGWDKGRR